MKKAILKISAFLMVIVVLLSTMSFTVSTHYCQGELVDTAIFQKAHTCGMEMGDESTMKKNGCCDDKEIHIEGQNELKLPVAENLSKNGIYLPSGLSLTSAQQNYVINIIKKIYN